MPEDMLERKASDPKIIRNFNKVKTIKDNAMMIFDVQQDGNSFSQMVADWPGEDIIGLWAYLKKHGQSSGWQYGSLRSAHPWAKIPSCFPMTWKPMYAAIKS